MATKWHPFDNPTTIFGGHLSRARGHQLRFVRYARRVPQGTPSGERYPQPSKWPPGHAWRVRLAEQPCQGSFSDRHLNGMLPCSLPKAKGTGSVGRSPEEPVPAVPRHLPCAVCGASPPAHILIEKGT